MALKFFKNFLAPKKSAEASFFFFEANPFFPKWSLPVPSFCNRKKSQTLSPYIYDYLTLLRPSPHKCEILAGAVSFPSSRKLHRFPKTLKPNTLISTFRNLRKFPWNIRFQRSWLTGRLICWLNGLLDSDTHSKCPRILIYFMRRCVLSLDSRSLRSAWL